MPWQSRNGTRVGCFKHSVADWLYLDISRVRLGVDRAAAKLEFHPRQTDTASMVAVEADQHEIRLTIPTDGMLPEEVSQFVTWLRVKVLAQRSKLTDATARQRAAEINAGWWERNNASLIVRRS